MLRVFFSHFAIDLWYRYINTRREMSLYLVTKLFSKKQMCTEDKFIPFDVRTSVTSYFKKILTFKN